MPAEVQSDLGTEVDNAIMTRVCQELKIEQRSSQPYLKRRTGGVERANRLISDALRRVLGTAITAWDLVASSVAFWLNTRFTETTASTPFALMFGRPPIPTEEKEAS